MTKTNSSLQFSLLAASAIVSSSLLFAACTGGAANSTKTQPAGDAGAIQAGDTQAEDKKGDTTLTGSVSEAGGRFFINPPTTTPKEIESYAIDLSAYVGQTVTVTGQYSGDTLFVGKLE